MFRRDSLWNAAIPRELLLLLFLASGQATSSASDEPVVAHRPQSTAEPATSFAGVREDWSTPSLETSTLRPIPPLIGPTDEQPNYVVNLVRVEWRPGDPIDLYIMRPKNVPKPPPVVLYLYGYPADTDRFLDREFQRLATKGGVAAVGFMTALTGQRYHDRPVANWFISELQESLATSAHDLQMVLDYLTTLNDFDMNRVGVFGQGSGGTVAILAAAVDHRIRVVDALDPWADWPDWFAKSAQVPEDERPLYLKPEFLEKIAPLDPVVWLPRLKSSKFRLEDAAFVRSTPRVSKDRLRSVMPATASYVAYATEADFRAVATDGKILDWIKTELMTLPASPNR